MNNATVAKTSKRAFPRKAQGNFYMLTPEISQKLRSAKLTAAEWRLWAYFTEIDAWGDRCQDIDPLLVMSECGIAKSTYCRARIKFQELGVLPDWMKKQDCASTEKQVRDNLQVKLGGQSEVKIAIERIDLLTDEEVIEVKEFPDWKEALGQVLAYSAFFPEHQKRIHLFGTAQQLKKLPNIEATCIAFDVLVTGEEA